MEFTIDFPFVRKITTQELAQASREIAEHGVVHAYEQSRERHNGRLASAPDANTLACKAGCSWCCYFSVDVRPVEVFSILEFIEKDLAPEQQTRVRSEIATNSTLLSTLSDLDRVQKNIKCPFLDAGRCTIYAARPQTCRNYHATDVAGCEKSFNEPDNLEIDPEFAPLVYQAGGAHVDAFAKAMSAAGYDVAAYELNGMLAAVMQDPVAARNRFEAKQTLFAELPSTEVGFEFVDLSDDDG